MRFAEHLGLAALAAALCGCAAVGEPLDALRRGAAAPAASASAPAVAAQEVPVAPVTQHAFEEAAKAMRAGRTAEAEQRFRALTQASPELGGPHANLGVIYRQGGKLPEAAAEFEQAVKLNARQPIYFNQLGVTYRQQGQFAKARAAYERAIELDPDYAAPYLNLGILCDLYLNDSARALDLFSHYLALSPQGDATVTKWVAELKNRKPTTVASGRKETS